MKEYLPFFAQARVSWVFITLLTVLINLLYCLFCLFHTGLILVLLLLLFCLNVSPPACLWTHWRQPFLVLPVPNTWLTLSKCLQGNHGSNFVIPLEDQTSVPKIQDVKGNLAQISLVGRKTHASKMEELPPPLNYQQMKNLPRMPDVDPLNSYTLRLPSWVLWKWTE